MSEDEDQADELAEDRLWRARNDMPGPLEMNARQIMEQNPELAAELGLPETVSDASAARASGSPAAYQLEQERAARPVADHSASAAVLEQLHAAIADGEPCSRLVELRKAMHPKAPQVDEANAELRRVGCWSAASMRTDQPDGA